LLNLADMFRLFKINKLKFTMVPAHGGQTGAQFTQMQPSLLFFVPYGASIPTDITGVENFPCGPLSSAFAFAANSGGTGYGLPPSTNLTLKLKHADLPILNAADPPGWLATMDDGSQTHLGTVCRVAVAAGSSSGVTSVTFYLRTEIDISFRDLVDPTSISAVVRAAQSPACTLHRGVLQGMIADAQKVPRALADPTPVSSPQDQKPRDLVATLKQLINE